MADGRKVEYAIYIKLDESAVADEKQETPEAALTSSGDTVSQKEKKQNAGKKDFEKRTRMAIAGYHYAKQLIAPIITNQVNTISLRTGNDEMQRRSQISLEIISAGVDVAEYALTGALLGFGGAGALVGAAVGIAAKAVNYSQQHYNYTLSRSVEQVSLSEARIRAGTSGDRIGKST